MDREEGEVDLRRVERYSEESGGVEVWRCGGMDRFSEECGGVEVDAVGILQLIHWML